MASNSGTGGLLLNESPSARTAALGDAMAGAAGDVAAFLSNPSLLSTIPTSQLSTQFNRGSFDDKTGSLTAGVPIKSGGFGVSASFYDAGTIDLIDAQSRKTVHAQRDWTAALGYARGSNRLSGGMTIKYLSSNLGERVSATAMAGDAGAQMALTPQFRLGVSVRNIGTSLRYVNESDSLPRLAGGGFSWMVKNGHSRILLLGESAYRLNQKDVVAGAGVEVGVGVLRLRAGYRTGRDLGGLTVGTGFSLGAAELNYAFGFVQDFQSQQRISFAFTFGRAKPIPTLSHAPVPPRIYAVQIGDTMESMVTRKKLEPGTRIVLPGDSK